MDMKKRDFKFKVKTLTEEGEFEGYASTFGNVDLAGEVIEEGAFKKTLQEHSKFPLLWYHDPKEVIGEVHAVEDKRGLFVKGKIITSLEKGREIYELLKRGILSGLSIGYSVIKDEWQNGVRKIKELKLWEVSLVVFPANPQARVSAVKAVVPYQDLPLAPMDMKWDADKATKRVAKWAGGPDKDKIDWTKYRRAFLWYDAENPQNYTSYKLPIADIVDGRLKAVPRGIFAAGAAIQGARGGVKIPAEDIEKIKKHLEKYYAKMDREPPWKTGKGLGLEEFLSGVAMVLQSFYNIHDEGLGREAYESLVNLEPVGATPGEGKATEELKALKRDIETLLKEVKEWTR